MRRESRRTLGELPESRQRSCCWPSIASSRLPPTRAIVHPPTVALPLTPAGLNFFSSHPPPPQLPLPTDEGVPRTDTLTPPTTRDEGVAKTQPPIPKPPLDSNNTREPSTRPEGVDDTKDHTATSRLEGVTNLDFNKQDSADAIPTTLLRVRGGSPKSKVTGIRVSTRGISVSDLFHALNAPEATAEDPNATLEPPFAGTPHPATPDPLGPDPTRTLSPLFELGASPSHTAPEVSLGTPPSPKVPGATTPDAPGIFGAPPSPTVPLAPGVPLGTVPAPSVLGAPPEPTPEPRVSPTPPELHLIDALRATTEAHQSTLSTIVFDISQLINSSRADILAQREVTDRIALDLKTSNSDRLAQRDATNRIALSQRDATDRIALDLKTSITTQSTKDDAFRDEISATMRLLAETQHLKHEELKLFITNTLLKAPSASLPDETEPTPTGPGASRFIPPPWSRGRSLRDTTRQPTRLAHPRHPAPADSPSSSPDKTTYRASAGTPNYPPDKHGAPRQRQRDAPGKLGDSPSTSHDKHHATYCRELDIASTPASKKYAIVAVVTINKITTVCASDQFRTWTLSRPQSTTVTIETAVWSLLHIGVLDAREFFADLDPIFCDFHCRLQHGETTDNTLDGILRLTFPDTRDTDPQTSVDGILQSLLDMGFDERTSDALTTHVPSNAAVKAATAAHLAPIDSPIRTKERNELRKTLLAALMSDPYSEDIFPNTRLGEFPLDLASSSSEHRRTLWKRLPQMDVAAALPQWTTGLSIQAFQQLLITTIHTDTVSLIADLLREQDPLHTILAAILRRHQDSAEFTMLVATDTAEHLNSELVFYKEYYASHVVDAQRKPADVRQHRSFLNVLCVCLAAIRSAFLGTSRDGALHSEARQFLTQLSTMHSTSDVGYLLEANAYWLRYSRLWGPALLISLCDGGQLQTLLPSVTARLSPPMQERILLFFGDIAHRLRVDNDNGRLPPAFASQLSSILKEPLLLHSTIPSLTTYAVFSDQIESLSAIHRANVSRGNHTHRIAHPADLAFVGKTGALADYWPAMIRHVLGHHRRVLVAPAAQIALVAWDDIYSNIE